MSSCLWAREHRADTAHQAIGAVETYRPQIPLRACDPPATIVEQSKSPQMLRTPGCSQLRRIPPCIGVSRQPFIPHGVGRAENLFQNWPFGDYQFKSQIPNPKSQILIGFTLGSGAW